MIIPSTYRGKLTSCRVRFLGHEYYFIQDRHSVAALWKQNKLSSPIEPYVLVLKYFFGMKKDALSVYKKDDSGPFHKPFAGSVVEPRNRIDWITHREILKGLTGPGLEPLTTRTAKAMVEWMNKSPVRDDWVEYPDLMHFFQGLIGSSIFESLAGPALFKLNPTFSDDFWKFDKFVPKFAKGIPDFLIAGSAQIRESLLEGLKKYYSHARMHHDVSDVIDHSSFDPFWGSGLMRARQSTFSTVDHQDDDSIASADLGLLWASVSNIVPSSMWATVHAFKDPSLLSRLRASLEQSAKVSEHPNDKALAKNTLLVSIYCETLRLYVKSYFLTSNQHADLPVGQWRIPKERVVFVNSGISHMDGEFWNTQGGVHPIDSFWGERFVTDPSDSSSGPLKPEIAAEMRSEKKQPIPTHEGEPYISMEGLEGSWIPYGGRLSRSLPLIKQIANTKIGGHAICPGRFLAKSTILLACALMVETFDLEIPGNIEMSYAKFGLGTLRPKHPIAFRIRRRSKQGDHELQVESQ